MSNQQPGPHPAQVPGAHTWHAPPQARPVSTAYRRVAGLLVALAVIIAALMAVAFVMSFVLLAEADADSAKGAHGYGAIFLWFGIAAAAPVLAAVAVPGVVMMRRVRQQRQAGTTPS
ncbi:hypothetical protein ACIBO4_32585 [Streptomyces sp. NPDC050149]|uniref:hypothetical protein n=1 Tax=Streptomyces sp. NPDC050149 TaxID=3365603 RepID=UPI0037A5DE7E